MMQRRRFLLAAAMTAASGLRGVWAAGTGAPEPEWRTFELTTQVVVKAASGVTRVWVPLPLAEWTPFQQSLGTTVQCESGSWKIMNGSGAQARLVFAEFPGGVNPELHVTSKVRTRDWTVLPTSPDQRLQTKPDSLHAWLQPTRYVPVDGVVRAKALEITNGAQTDEQKARAVYRWIIANTYRKASVHGCGTGDIGRMLALGDLGGKCADLNALFVGLARAAGLPARDVYGIRVAPSRWGYKSLGPANETVTKAQHCRAEVWLQRYGWVPVDPADVRKVVLEESPGGLPMDHPRVLAAKARLFGAWEMNWVGWNYAQDVQLPGSNGPALHYFMYPQAETAEGRLDCLDPETFRYAITSREV